MSGGMNEWRNEWRNGWIKEMKEWRNLLNEGMNECNEWMMNEEWRNEGNDCNEGMDEWIMDKWINELNEWRMKTYDNCCMTHHLLNCTWLSLVYVWTLRPMAQKRSLKKTYLESFMFQRPDVCT